MGKFKIIQFALYQALIAGLLGVVCGVIYSFGGLLIDVAVSLGWLSGETWGTLGLSKGTLLALMALIGMPWILTIVGFAAGILEGILIKIILNMIGKIS